MPTKGKSRHSTLTLPDGERREMMRVVIPPPAFRTATFHITGISPLVISRFSQRAKYEIEHTAADPARGSKKKKKVVNPEQVFKESRYYHADGWEGFHAAAIRNGMISACRLVNFKMTLAKLSVFVQPDGVDKLEPQIPLIRINGKAVRQTDHVRNKNSGQFSLTHRAAYHDWSADVRIRFDTDQFGIVDITHLLMRVGEQVGIGCGRPDSKESAGMGWGLFNVAEGGPAHE